MAIKKSKLNELGRRLKIELAKRDIQFTEFAKMLGTSRPYLWTIMHRQDFNDITKRKWELMIADGLRRFDESEGGISA